MRIKHGAETNFRHNFMVGLVLVANVGLLAPFIAILIARPLTGGYAIGAAVVAGILWLIWLFGWWSKVAIGPDGVTIDNVIVRHFIPWEQLRDIRAEGGLTFELTDGTGVGSASYGASLAGALTGWRGLRRVREQMLAARSVPAARMPPPGHEPGFRIKIAWWGLVAYLVPLEAIAIISGLGHHMPIL